MGQEEKRKGGGKREQAGDRKEKEGKEKEGKGGKVLPTSHDHYMTG